MAVLLTTGGITVKSGATPDLIALLRDNSGSALTKAAITSLTLTIKDATGSIVNSRNATDINDTGIGSLVDGASTVTLTVKPVAADTTHQGAESDEEVHTWRIDWGWTDGDGDARIGSETYDIIIERLPVAN